MIEPVTILTQNGWLMIRPTPERIDLAVAPAIRDAVKPHLSPGARVLVDLECVRFMDSMALGVLVSWVRAVGDEGLVRLARPTQEVRMLLQFTRLASVLPIFDTLEQAQA